MLKLQIVICTLICNPISALDFKEIAAEFIKSAHDKEVAALQEEIIDLKAQAIFNKGLAESFKSKLAAVSAELTKTERDLLTQNSTNTALKELTHELDVQLTQIPLERAAVSSIVDLVTKGCLVKSKSKMLINFITFSAQTVIGYCIFDKDKKPLKELINNPQDLAAYSLTNGSIYIATQVINNAIKKLFSFA